MNINSTFYKKRWFYDLGKTLVYKKYNILINKYAINN